MPVVHPIVGVDRLNFFVTNFFDQPREHRAGNFINVYFIDFLNGLKLTLDQIQGYFLQIIDLL